MIFEYFFYCSKNQIKLSFILIIRFPNCVCVVYTGDREAKEEDLIQKAYDRFNIDLDKNRTKFVYLRFRFLVLDKYYPVFTLLGRFD
jgi:hypothetical protein